jgi:hypothetical protein
MSNIVKRLRAPVTVERNDGIRLEAACEIERLRVVNTALVEALEALFEALELGPLECAAKYGPDMDHREFESRAAEKARAALTLAKDIGA